VKTTTNCTDYFSPQINANKTKILLSFIYDPFTAIYVKNNGLLGYF